MAVTFHPQLKIASNVSFKQNEAAPTAVAPATISATPPVNIEKQPEAPKKSGIANFTSNLAYLWINMTESVKGVVKGTFAAVFVGTTIAGVDTVVSGVNKKAYKEIFTKPTKAMGAVGKIVAPIVAAMVFTGYIISAKLKANKRTANVDHQLYTNHRTKAGS